MNSFATILKLDFNATFRSRWFWVYAVLVIASMGGIFATGISDSRVAGFTGLTRPLLIFIQAATQSCRFLFLSAPFVLWSRKRKATSLNMNFPFLFLWANIIFRSSSPESSFSVLHCLPQWSSPLYFVRFQEVLSLLTSSCCIPDYCLPQPFSMSL